MRTTEGAEVTERSVRVGAHKKLLSVLHESRFVRSECSVVTDTDYRGRGGRRAERAEGSCEKLPSVLRESRFVRSECSVVTDTDYRGRSGHRAGRARRLVRKATVGRLFRFCASYSSPGAADADYEINATLRSVKRDKSLTSNGLRIDRTVFRLISKSLLPA